MGKKISLQNLEVKSFVTNVQNRASQVGGSMGDVCASNATCNAKCGATNYWECGPHTELGLQCVSDYC